MRLINMAHGALYLLGVYVGFMLLKDGGNFLLAAIVGGIVAGIAGWVMERGFLRYLHGELLAQVLLTFGFVYIITNACNWIWGPRPAIVSAPISGSVILGKVSFPAYRLFLIFIGLLMACGLYLFQEKTKIGAMVRAGMDNREMTMALGINFELVCRVVFILGSFLAGFAGILGAPIFGAYLTAGVEVLTLALIVVVFGGIGSIQGVLIGSLVMGLAVNFTAVYFPLLSYFVMYMLLIITLIMRPSGLLGKKA